MFKTRVLAVESQLIVWVEDILLDRLSTQSLAFETRVYQPLTFRINMSPALFGHIGQFEPWESP